METLITRGHFSPQITKSTSFLEIPDFREIPHLTPRPSDLRATAVRTVAYIATLRYCPSAMRQIGDLVNALLCPL